MLSLLLSLTLSAWRTSHIGRPVNTAEDSDYLLISTEDYKLHLFNKTSGEKLWRQSVPKVKVIALGSFVVAASKDFYYMIDLPTGIIIYQYKHAQGKPVAIGISEEKVLIASNSSLALYDNSTVIWQSTIQSEPTSIQVFNDSVICGGYKFSISNGSVLSPAQSVAKALIDLRFFNTSISLYSDSALKWTINQPLFGSHLKMILSRSAALFTNDSHIIVYDIREDKVLCAFEDSIVSVEPTKAGFIAETTKGVFSFNLTTLTLSTFNGTVARKYLNKTELKDETKTLFAFPETCAPKCSADCRDGSVFIAAQCADDIASVVVAANGRPKYPMYTENSHIGTCWCTKDFATISYMRRKSPMVTSFSLTNSSQRSLNTEKLIVTASHGRYLMSDGQMQLIPSDSFNPLVMTAAKGGSALAAMMGGTGGVSMDGLSISGPRDGGAYSGVRSIVSSHDITILEGYDFLLLETTATESGYDTYLIVASISLIVAVIVVNIAFGAKRSAFWK